MCTTFLAIIKHRRLHDPKEQGQHVLMSPAKPRALSNPHVFGMGFGVAETLISMENIIFCPLHGAYAFSLGMKVMAMMYNVY